MILGYEFVRKGFLQGESFASYGIMGVGLSIGQTRLFLPTFIGDYYTEQDLSDISNATFSDPDSLYCYYDSGRSIVIEIPSVLDFPEGPLKRCVVDPEDKLIGLLVDLNSRLISS